MTTNNTQREREMELEYVTFDPPHLDDFQLRVPKSDCGPMYHAHDVDPLVSKLRADLADARAKVAQLEAEKDQAFNAGVEAAAQAMVRQKRPGYAGWIRALKRTTPQKEGEQG